MVHEPTPTEKLVERITQWVGSVSSLLVHTLLFVLAFLLSAVGYAAWDTVLLVVTTIVSLEAIYLAIFIQMTVNRQAKELHEVSEDVDEIQEDIDEIQKDVDEIQEDVDEIQEDVEEMTAEEKEIERQNNLKRKNRTPAVKTVAKTIRAKVQSAMLGK